MPTIPIRRACSCNRLHSRLIRNVSHAHRWENCNFMAIAHFCNVIVSSLVQLQHLCTHIHYPYNIYLFICQIVHRSNALIALKWCSAWKLPALYPYYIQWFYSSNSRNCHWWRPIADHKTRTEYTLTTGAYLPQILNCAFRQLCVSYAWSNLSYWCNGMDESIRIWAWIITVYVCVRRDGMDDTYR